MTGTELFEALSFVDERYIAEAETARLGRNVPWMKVLSVAACLCILVVGVCAYGQLRPKGAMEEAMEAAAPAAAVQQESATEAVLEEEPACPPAEAEPQAVPETVEATAAGELQQTGTVALRIISITDAGFEAIVEEVSAEPTPLEVGMQVSVVIDSDKVPDSRVQTDSKMSEGSALKEELLVQVEDGAYDAGINTLYVEGVIPAD